jgi:hypothetical protein
LSCWKSEGASATGIKIKMLVTNSTKYDIPRNFNHSGQGLTACSGAYTVVQNAMAPPVPESILK